MFETEERLYFRKNRGGYKAKSSEYLLYSEDFQRSKRRFLLGKTTFDFQRPWPPNIQNAPERQSVPGAAYEKQRFSAKLPTNRACGPVRRARRGVILNEKGVLHPFFKLFPRTLLFLLCLFR